MWKQLHSQSHFYQLNIIVNLFAWKPQDMLDINHDIIAYELNVDHTKKLIQQRRRRFVREKSDIIKNKVNPLKRVG